MEGERVSLPTVASHSHPEGISEHFPMRRKLTRSAVFVAAVVVIAAGVWGAVWWARYPKVPDLARTDAVDAIRFIGTDDFNRMTEAHRKRYAIAAAEKLRDKSFQDLVAMSMTPDPSYRRIAENMNRLKDRDAIGGAYMRVFLDKFFELPRDQREAYLTMWALAEKLALSGQRPAGQSAGGGGGIPFMRRRSSTTQPAAPTTRPSEPRVPTPEQIEKGMASFLANQPPRTVAQMSELMSAMRKKREAFGIR